MGMVHGFVYIYIVYMYRHFLYTHVRESVYVYIDISTGYPIYMCVIINA